MPDQLRQVVLADLARRQAVHVAAIAPLANDRAKPVRLMELLMDAG